MSWSSVGLPPTWHLASLVCVADLLDHSFLDTLSIAPLLLYHHALEVIQTGRQGLSDPYHIDDRPSLKLTRYISIVQRVAIEGTSGSGALLSPPWQPIADPHRRARVPGSRAQQRFQRWRETLQAL